jgi:outer membrane receptor protein involved in Fe transport
MVRYEPIEGLYFKLRGTWFGKNFANFNPETLQGSNGGRDSWRMPDYGLLDLNTGYTFNVNNTKVTVRVNVLNLLDSKYISDAQNNDTRAPGVTTETFDARSASTFFGLGRQWNVSLLVGL